MLKRTSTLLIVLALLLLAVPVLAQVAQPEPVTGVATELLTAREADGLFKAAGRSVGLGIVASPLILLLVQLLKFIPPLDRFKAENLASVTAFVVVVIGSVVFNAGYGDLFDSSYQALSGFAQPLITIVTAIAGSGLLFKKVITPGAGDKSGFLSRSRSPGA